MKSLAYTIIIFILLSLGLTFLLTELGIKDSISTAVGASATVFANIREAISKILKEIPLPKNKIANFEHFGKSTFTVFTYSFMSSLAVINLLSTISNIIASIIGFSDNNIMVQAGFLLVLAGFPMLYLIGKWMGKNMRKTMWSLPLLVSICVRLFNTCLDYFFLSTTDFKRIYNIEKTTINIINNTFLGIIILSVLLYLGYWIGKKQRTTAYFHSLLHKLPVDTQNLIINMVYEAVVDNSKSKNIGDGKSK